MLNTPCPECGQPKNPNAKRCKKCFIESRRGQTISPEMRDRIRLKLLGVKHTEERRRNISAGKQRSHREGRSSPFDIAGHMRGKPHPFAKPPGTERIVKDGRVQVRCEDGTWRYRSRLVWAAAHGSIPHGRVIHHKNEDPMDDRLENLRMLTRAEHARLHADPDVMRARQLLAAKARKGP